MLTAANGTIAAAMRSRRSRRRVARCRSVASSEGWSNTTAQKREAVNAMSA
jgi:hypothetical protein